MQIDLTVLSAKEKETFESLVQLGDSKQLAFDTVLDLRNRPDNTEFYRYAYEN